MAFEYDGNCRVYIKTTPDKIQPVNTIHQGLISAYLPGGKLQGDLKTEHDGKQEYKPIIVKLLENQ